MILNKLVLHDFGLYGGHNEFDLRPRNTAEGYRPIILFGGKNGTGKTTILEAVRLCLYGRDAIGVRVPTSEYHAHLKRRLHRSRHHVALHSSVALEFEYLDGEEKSTFLVERYWRETDRGIEEFLSLRKNGQVQFGLAPEYWPDFLKDLIPLGLSDLFFFDGERIQTLADDQRGGPALATALKDLLGVNLIEQLEGDLGVYLSRYSKSEGMTEVTDKLTELRNEIAALEETRSERFQDRAGAQARLDRILSKVADKKAEIAGAGGSFVENRTKAEAQRLLLESTINQLRRRLEDACAGLLPFALAPRLARSLSQQLEQEESIEYKRATRAVLHNQAALLAQQISDEEFWRDLEIQLSGQAQKALHNKVRDIVLSHADSTDAIIDTDPIHGLSAQDRAQLKNWITSALGPVAQDTLADVEVLQRAEADLERAIRVLNAVPPEELLRPLIEELHSLQAQENQLRAEIEQHTKALDKLSYDLTELQRQVAKLESLVRNTAKLQAKGSLAAHATEALAEFRQQLLRLKIADLEAAFSDYFNRLARKNEFLSHVIINERDFSMTLVSREGRYIQKTQLSAGEKQIYAISLLWALRAVAARPLPIIIDTPLGRLDSSHRQNLVDYYFPNASHQVIILSTDTEIDSAYFAQLDPFISHAYHLVYDDATGMTHADAGYFWEPAVPEELEYAAQ